jgi:site-specific DNA-methyltransferase (adenine-specific)
MYESNVACGVANAATRKYLTQDHLWYFPPGDAVVRMASWCTANGLKTKRPYFSIDGKEPPTAEAWDSLRAKWTHTHGMTNVWHEPPVHNGERVKIAGSSSRYLHANQKPLALMKRQIVASTSPGDTIWEPFGGLCSATVAAIQLGRRACAAKKNGQFYAAALSRVDDQVTILANGGR